MVPSSLLLISAPAVLSHKHSHSGAPPHPRPGSAGHHHWHGKGGLGDPDDSSEPRGLGVCTSRARPGHGTRPDSLSAGSDNAGPGTSTACSAGRATPSRCTKHVILSCPLWPPGLLSSDNPIIVSSKKKKIFCGTQGSTHTPATGRSQDRTDHPSCRLARCPGHLAPRPLGAVAVVTGTGSYE